MSPPIVYKEFTKGFMKPLVDDFAGTADKFLRTMFTLTSDLALVERIVRNAVSSDREQALSAIRELFTCDERESGNAFQRVGRRLRNINADPKGENKRLHDSVVLIPGVGHFVPQEKPAEFNQALEAIVKQFVESAAKK